jgi:hypothetical protein
MPTSFASAWGGVGEHVRRDNPIRPMSQAPDDADTDDYDAEDLVQYFDTRIADSPKDEYVLGAKFVREWQSLRLRSDVTQTIFDDFMSRIEATETAGSAYAHLWITVRNWGYLLGFSVPRNPPPRLTGHGNSTLCMSNTGFETQTTIGKTYEVLELDHERSLVRIANDQQENQWYPCNLFQFPVTLEREFVQQPDW